MNNETESRTPEQRMNLFEKQNGIIKLITAAVLVIAVPLIIVGQAPSPKPAARGTDGVPHGSQSYGAGRFELVQLHPNADSLWSGVLDTQTGCVWIFASQKPPASPKTSPELYRAVVGEHLFQMVAYDATEYVSSHSSAASNAGTVGDFSEAIQELGRVTTLCNKARVQALEAAVVGTK